MALETRPNAVQALRQVAASDARKMLATAALHQYQTFLMIVTTALNPLDTSLRLDTRVIDLALEAQHHRHHLLLLLAFIDGLMLKTLTSLSL